MASEGEPIYCLCRLPYDETQFMIECDVCKDWFHGGCVGVQEHQAVDIEIYHCPNCSKRHGPLVLKKRKNWHRHDHFEEGSHSSSAVQTGTSVFIKELKKRSFPPVDEIPVRRVHGSQLTTHSFDQDGFDAPVLCEKKDGLGLTLPPPSFTIQDVEDLVGPMREIDVINVSRQEDIKMIMREWTEYYNSTNRDKILNVISLEFSDTRMSELVVPPSIVRQVSWARNIWPDQLPEDSGLARPEVQKYCLMGVKDSFTDFHIDFGGTSVWYHILRGEKVFYFIRPTEKNLALYEHWLSSAKQSETFFGDLVDNCYRQVVKQGQTLFIPTGWIHAVLTPIDSLVFGGNFLHNYNVPLQLQCYEIEKLVKTPDKFLFPNYETMNWYAAKCILDLIKDYTEEKKSPPDYLANGARALMSSLKGWTQRKDYAKVGKQDAADYIQYGKLLKDLAKEIKVVDALSPPSPKKSKAKKKGDKPTPTKSGGTPKKVVVGLDVLEEHTKETLKASDRKQRESIYNFQDEEEEPPLSLKVRIPKAGAYLPDPAAGAAAAADDSSTTKNSKEKENKEVKVKKELKRGGGAGGRRGGAGKKQHEPPAKKAKVDIKEEDDVKEEEEKIKSEESSEAVSPQKEIPQCLKFKLSNGKMVSTDRKSKAKKMKKNEFLLLGEDITKKEEDTKESEKGRKKVSSPKKEKQEKEKVKKKPNDSTKKEEKDKVKKKNNDSTKEEKDKVKKKNNDSTKKEEKETKSVKKSSSSKAKKSETVKDKQSSPSVSKKKKLKNSSSSSSSLSEKKISLSSSSEKKISSSSSSEKKISSSQSPSSPPLISSPPQSSSSSSSSRVKKTSSSSKSSSSEKKKKAVKTSGESSGSGLVVQEAKDRESDSDSGNGLVMDMNPKKPRNQKTSSTTKPASLKMRLPPGSQKNSDGGDDGAVSNRLGLDTIHGGLNGSISDILTASGYGTETAFRVDGDGNGMRDAIAGMLTMSRMGQEGDAKGDGEGGGLFTGKDGEDDPGNPSKLTAAEEEKKLMSDCYEDDDFVYPSFELSDDEDSGASSPTKKTHDKDDNWNPKARVQTNVAKSDRDHREGVQKKSMAENLAATAAKLAEKPPKDKKNLKKVQKAKVAEVVKEFEVQPLPGPSSSLDDDEPVNAFRPGIKRPVDPCANKDPVTDPNKAKKPKKGLATAKQRLGKLLKIKKMVF